MKLKRILSVVVVLAMVLSIVPAFGLTASAAETTTVSSTIADAEVVWSMPTNIYWSDTPVSAGLTGWRSNEGAGGEESHINLANDGNYNYLQVYGRGPNVTATSPGYAAGAETIIIEGKFCRSDHRYWKDGKQVAGRFWQNWVFKDIDGQEIGHAWIDQSHVLPEEENPWGCPSHESYTDLALVAKNNADGTHSNYWYVNGELKWTQENKAGKVNGFGSFAMPSGGADTWYNNMRIANLTISAVYPADTTHTITVNYGTTGTKETLKGVSGTTVTAPAKTITTGNTVYVFDAAAYTIGDSDAKETLEPARTLSFDDGLVAHYSLESDVTDSVGARNGEVIGSTGVTYDPNGYVTFPGGVGAGAIELPNEIMSCLTGDFTVSMWVRQDPSYASDGNAITFWDMVYDYNSYDRFYYQQKGNEITVQHRGDHSKAYTVYNNSATKDKWALVTASFDLDTNTLTTYINGVALTAAKTEGTWAADQAPANIYNRENGAVSFYLGHNAWNNEGNPEMKGDMAEVRIYNKALTADEVSALLADKKTVKVKYVADGKEIADSTVVDYFSSAAAFDVPTTIEAADGAVYELTGDHPADAASVSVTTSDTEYTATYTAVDTFITGVEEIPAVTVIEGNEPVLPKTVTVLTNNAGITYEANVRWDTSSLTAGTEAQEVTGTVDGYDVTAKVMVTVLPETFNVKNISSANGAVNNTTAFTVPITGDFVFEFDYLSSEHGDDWIYISQNPGETGMWSGGNLAIGVGNNKISAPTSLGGSPAAQLGDALNVNEKYRFLVKGSTKPNSYNIIITDANGNIVLDGSKTYCFRTNDTANGIPLNYINIRGGFELSNIKVNAPSAADKVKTYMVNYVSGDTNLQSTKAYYAVDKQYGYNKDAIFPNVEIKAFDGYVFHTKTVAGDAANGYTVTLNYEPTDESAYFFDNVENGTKFVSLNMLGAHDAFTAKMDGNKSDAAGAKQGDSGSFWASSAYLGKSKAQSADALTMLNSGVRYFDIRLSRSDKKYLGKPHTNGVFYTTHGLLGEEFRPIAYTIGQWLKAHPGEIVVLDFQETWDYTGSHDGNALRDTEEAIKAILSEAGVMDYVTINNGTSLKEHTYGSLTSNGTKAATVVFGRSRAATAGGTDFGVVDKFLLRGTTSNAFGGQMYSNYDKGGASVSTKNLDAAYIQAQVDHLKDLNTVLSKPTADNPIVDKYRVMQAISDTNNLISQAATDNSYITDQVKASGHEQWLTALPVIMVNDAVTNTAELLGILKSCNAARKVTVNYTVDGKTVATKEKDLMVGTLYTDEAAGGIIKSGADAYKVTAAPVTAPSDAAAITPVPYNGDISAAVEKLGNVYGINYGTEDTASGTYYESEGSYFPAFFWNDNNKTYRVGVAVLNAEENAADVQDYVLQGTRTRWYSKGHAIMKFYAVSYEDYLKADLTTRAGYNNLISDANLVYSETKTVEDDDKTAAEQTLVLNRSIMNEKIADGKVVILGVATGGLYGMADDMAITTAQKPLGVTIVDGAQVRIGQKLTGDKIVPSKTGSGLRFIATVEPKDNLAATKDAEVGILIYPADVAITDFNTENNNLVVIPAKTYQDEAKTTFSVALTNLHESNYNRSFTAKPYVKIDGKYYTDDQSVTRSIYKVAAGLLTTEAGAEGGNHTDLQLMSDDAIAVLNAYLNQVGIRLDIKDIAANGTVTARMSGNGAYTGDDAFFDITVGTTGNGGVYEITLKAKGKASFSGFWKDYIRINNNNSAVKQGITEFNLIDTDGDGKDDTLKFKFDYAQAKAAQDAASK